MGGLRNTKNGICITLVLKGRSSAFEQLKQYYSLFFSLDLAILYMQLFLSEQLLGPQKTALGFFQRWLPSGEKKRVEIIIFPLQLTNLQLTN